MNQGHKDLVVWQKAMTLTTFAYELLRTYPKEELFGLTSQMKRSAVSIPSNIAEGYGRSTTKDYKHFLSIVYEILSPKPRRFPSINWVSSSRADPYAIDRKCL